MRASDFVAPLRHPRTTVRRLRGTLRAAREIVEAYAKRWYRYRHRDPERFWDSLERWAERRSTVPLPPGEDRITHLVYRAVLRRYARSLTELALQYPNEPERRLRSLTRDLVQVRLYELHYS